MYLNSPERLFGVLHCVMTALYWTDKTKAVHCRCEQSASAAMPVGL
ncbi:MAG TPA: hypothetical protein V6D29_22160 [Leptolyngbyaceae cyanobacterium]